jgi:endonuclease/exonuclease/phosphatase family metal-dependent hydrolase
MQVFRVVTLNIAHGRGLAPFQGFLSASQIERNLQRIAKVLTDAQADFVVMQEVDQASWWNMNINLLDVIRHNTPYHYSYVGINNIRDGKRNLNYGNAILSKHPIESRFNQPFKLSEIGGKGFMAAEIHIAENSLAVINMHLDFRSRVRRVQQIDRVIEFLETKDLTNNDTLRPIICGDFNCPRTRSGDAVLRLFQYLQEHGYNIYPQKARTFPAYFPIRTIDFIFMPQQYTVIDTRVLPVYVSDHRPVLVEFQLDNA